MKHIKRFSDIEKVEESITAGICLGGGLITIALAGLGQSIINWAKASWTKKMMEMKYKRTGKEETIPYKNGEDEILFEQMKDVSTGETFWGVTYVDKTGANPSEENQQYLLFDEAGYKKVKEKLISGEEGFLSNPTKSWSKTPSRL